MNTPEDPDDGVAAPDNTEQSSPETVGTTMKSILAGIDAAMERSAAEEQAAATDPPEPSVAGDATRKGDADPSSADSARSPIASTAEFRSRLHWFIGVSEPGPQDPGALTYEPYFGLREKPFSLSPDPRFFFSRCSHGAAFDTLAAGIRRREGLLVLSGEVGTGKTTLCRAVLQSFDQKTFAAFVPDPFLSREDLLKTLLVDFGVVSVDEVRRGRLRGATRADLSYPLYEFLASLQPLRAFAVVLIDEAQNLKPELLEEIRVLSDLDRGQKLLEVVLVGQPELQSRLATTEMRQLNQRVSIRCELAALEPVEVAPYISHRLAVAGNDGRIEFNGAAIDLVVAASGGIPRLINLLCDRGLLQAARSRQSIVEARHVATAIAELKLPAASRAAAHAIHVAAPPPPPSAADDRQTEALPAFLKEFRPELNRSAAATESPAREDVLPDSPSPPPERLMRTSRLQPLSLLADRPADDTFWGGAPDPSSGPDAEPGRAAVTPLRGRWLGIVATCIVLSGGLAGVLYSGASVQALAAGLVGYWYSGVPVRSVQPSHTTQAREIQAPPTPVSFPVPASEAAVVTTDVPPERSTADTSGRFAVQIATFQTSARAEQSVQELRDAGYPAYGAERSLRDGNRMFAVLLGPYDGRAAAEQDRDRAQHVPGYGIGLIVPIGPTAP